MTLPAPPITPQLGCVDNYRAKVFRWDRTNSPVPGLRMVAELPKLSAVSWERVDQDMADASVSFAPSTGDDCCAQLAPRWNARGELIQTGIWPYAHELAIYRGDAERPCFMGPITPIPEQVERDGSTELITLHAKDILHYLDVRLTHQDMWFQYSAPDRPIAWGEEDPVLIAQWLINEATSRDDPGLRQAMTYTPTGRLVQRTGRNREFYVGQELRDLARAGISFYSVGRAAYVHGDWQPYEGKRLKRLTQADFQGKSTILVDALHAATAVSVVGAVPSGATDPTNTPPAKSYQGGVDPFFGEIERLVKADRITDQSTLDAIGRRVVGYGNPPPTVITLDGSAVLSPKAPVSIHDLIPSRWFELSAQGTCRQVSQVMKLNHVKVDWSGNGQESGMERVQVAFSPPPITSEVA